MDVTSPPDSAAAVATLPDPTLREAFAEWRAPALALGLGLVALGVLFQAEAAAAFRTWIDSTAYNHCFLVVPIALWLLWDRRDSLVGLRAQPLPWAALAGLPLAAGWLVAERLGIMEGRQLMAMTFLEVLLFAVLGWRLWRAVCGPLLYLYFLVPFGDFLVPKLQDLTTAFTRYGLDILGIPAFIDGYTIEIPEGTFYVAEACAGLRFLIASIAFGCLYATIMYRSPRRRMVFVGLSVIVPVIANGFRAMGIVVLGHILGSAQAAATDHVLYGWIFFSLVILLLIALGLPFREDDRGYGGAPVAGAAVMGVPRMGAALAAAAAAVVVALISPAVAMGLNQRVVAPEIRRLALDPGLGCSTLPVPEGFAVGTPGRLGVQQIACGPVLFTIRVEVFSPRTTAGPVTAERRRLTRMPDSEDSVEDWLPGSDQRVWRLVRGSDPLQAIAVGLWVGGQPTRIGLALRARMAWHSLVGTPFAPVLVTIAPAVDWLKLSTEERRRAERSLTEFLLSHPALPDQIPALVRTLG
jgi:exosortase A